MKLCQIRIHILLQIIMFLPDVIVISATANVENSLIRTTNGTSIRYIKVMVHYMPNASYAVVRV